MSRNRTAVRILAVVAVAAAAAVVAAPANADTTFKAKAPTWDKAAARLGTAGSLWDPAKTLTLPQVGQVSVAADGLKFVRGRAIAGDTIATARYGRGTTSFTISEKWANTGWAAEPAFTTSMARVGTVMIPIGLPGTKIRVRATIWANCFIQPTDADPTEIPKWFRCAQAQVLTTGGVLTMTARPSSTMAAPGNTTIVIQTKGITYGQLISIASGLQQVAGAAADGAGSAQMLAMCGQMKTSRMTLVQANTFAISNGYSARVGSIDGVPQAVTMDYRPDRFTVSMVANAVTGCTYG